MTALVLVAQLALGGPAGALPKGAFWYGYLDLPKAWSVTEGAGVTVAVIDSGVQASLGDLRGQVLPGLDLTGSHPAGQTDSIKPGTNDFGHGSDMAALIAGTGKGGGLVGVAPKAKILPVSVVGNNGRTTDAAIATGLRWAVDHHASVVNISLGEAGDCSPVDQAALGYAYQHNVIVVVSAGDTAGPVYSPANCPGAIAVGAIDSSFQLWQDSASGPETDFVAPGVDLVNEELNNTISGPYPGNSGTSQATALVSGTFALLRAKFPTESAREIVTRAMYNVHDGLGLARVGQYANTSIGYGMILPYDALTEAPPANAVNGIYDRIAAAFPSGSTSSAVPSATASSPNGSGSAPTSGAGSHASGNDSNSSPISPVFIIFLVLVVIAGATILLTSRRAKRRRQQYQGTGGAWPPQQGPPQQGPPR